MTRRKLIASSPAAASLAAQTSSAAAPHYLMLRKIYLRNSADNQSPRLTEFLEKSALPALQRAGASGIGFFSAMLAPDSPFILTTASFPTLLSIETAMGKLAEDSLYTAGAAAFHKIPGQRYVRFETSLFRCFTGFPQVARLKPGNRVFELRTYESDTPSSLAEKIKMFNQGEIDIFKRTGLEPVFFGESIFGGRQPNLTYMLCYDDLAAREANWKKFVTHPDWLKLRLTPGWSDAEIVSNISSSFLRGLPFSPIR